MSGKPSTEIQEENQVADKPAVPSVSSPHQAPDKDSGETANATSSSTKEEMQLDKAVAADSQGLHAELPAHEAPETAEHMQS